MSVEEEMEGEHVLRASKTYENKQIHCLCLGLCNDGQ